MVVFCGFPPVVGLHVFFLLKMAIHLSVIVSHFLIDCTGCTEYRLQLSNSPLHQQAYTRTHRHLLFLSVLFHHLPVARVVMLLRVPVFPLAFRATFPCSMLPNSPSTPLPMVPALSIDTLLQFPPLLDLGRNHSHVAPTSHSSSCSTWLLCSYAFTFSVYCFGAVLWKKENEEDRILRDVVTIVDNICIAV